MSQSLQEKASEILASVIDFTPEQAAKQIKQQCGNDERLLEYTLSLYNEIVKDSTSEKPENDIKYSEEGQSKSRIGMGGNTTRAVGSLTRMLFGDKIRRMISLVAFLVFILMLGIFIRQRYRHFVIEMERQEQITMLNINYKSLQQWIDSKTELTRKVALQPDIIGIASYLDSLVNLDPSYSKLRNNPHREDIYSRLNEIRKIYEIESMSIINNRDPIYMVLTESTMEGADNAFSDIQLGTRGYDYYIKLQDLNSSMFMPPMHDREKFKKLPEGLHVGTYCTFCEPIYKGEELVGYLYNDYNVKNEFSSILNLSHHNETAETYAFSRDGHMLSQSRFAEELRHTYLLDYDSTKESIYNIQLLDPGSNVYKSNSPKIPRIDQTYTRIMAQAQEHLNKNDGVFSGSIMTPYNDYRGIKVVGAWNWLPQYDFGLIDEIDSWEALIALRYFDGAFFLFLFLLILLTLLLYNSNVRIAKFGKRIEDFSKLGQYKLLEKLGEGGFGEVYKAEHTFLKTPVAIKLLKKEFIGTDMLDRFEREVKVTSSLAHPNTVRVFDYGTSSSGQFYYVMEYLNGVSLDKVVRQSKNFPVNRAVHVLLHCSYSLLEAHNKGLVHRDIKPMNIMLCNQGGAYDEVKILDFGLVKNIDTTKSQQTQINRIGGTPMFMAPERLRDPYHTDHRVDIYALGAVGIYMFSGQFLLEIISQKMLSGQETLQGNFKNNLIERDDVPMKLKSLLESCVSFEPSKRPDSLTEIIALLEDMQLEYPWTRVQSKEWWKKYDIYGS